ncbi:MAG: hypothetical protein RLZZ164_375 [Actinomycetota bacterium]
MLSSSLNVKAVASKRSRGLISGAALLGLSAIAAINIATHAGTPTSNLAAAATGTTSSSSSSSSKSSASTNGSATSDAVNYRYGTVQLKVTQSNGKITAIDLVQAGATAGREQAFSYLVNDAISANGTSFSNLSGATFTTDAFKQALSSAISKL